MSNSSRSRAARASARAIIGGGVCQRTNPRSDYSSFGEDCRWSSMRFPVQLAAGVPLALPATASAQLPSLPLPPLPVPDLPAGDLPVPIPDPGDLISDPGQVVTDVGGTVGGALPGDVGVVTTTTGQVGGIVTQTTTPVTGA